MSTTYTGIDYGRGVSNRDPETGIRYGVIAQNSVNPDAFDDVWQNARDLTYEQAKADAEAACERDGTEFDEDSFNDEYSMCDCGERDWLYESDGYKLTNCLVSDVFVLASPYYTYAQFCSPCVPGACNLDSPLERDEVNESTAEDNRAYCLGHDYFDGGRAPYPVYSVATGELVQPAE